MPKADGYGLVNGGAEKCGWFYVHRMFSQLIITRQRETRRIVVIYSNNKLCLIQQTTDLLLT